MPKRSTFLVLHLAAHQQARAAVVRSPSAGSIIRPVGARLRIKSAPAPPYFSVVLLPVVPASSSSTSLEAALLPVQSRSNSSPERSLVRRTGQVLARSACRAAVMSSWMAVAAALSKILPMERVAHTVSSPSACTRGAVPIALYKILRFRTFMCARQPRIWPPHTRLIAFIGI